MIEWLGEMLNPGPVGGLDIHNNSRNRTRLSAILTGIPAIAIILAPIIYIYARWNDAPQLFDKLSSTLLIEVVYLFTAYFIKPEPDYSNMGWFGGFLDNPFRLSDGFNRFLFFLLLLLSPGRLISIGLVDFIKVMFLLFKKITAQEN